MLGISHSEPALQQPPSRHHGQGRNHGRCRAERLRKRSACGRSPQKGAQRNPAIQDPLRGLARSCDSTWSINTVSGRFLPGEKERVFSNSAGKFYDPEGKICKPKKAPQTQIMLVPVSFVPDLQKSEISQVEVSLDCKDEDSPQACPPRSASAGGPKPLHKGEERNGVVANRPSSVGSAPVAPTEKNGKLETSTGFSKPTIVSPRDDAVADASPASPAKFSKNRRASLDTGLDSPKTSPKSSPKGCRSLKGFSDDSAGLTLKEWFDSVERERTNSSMSGASSRLGPSKSPLEVSSPSARDSARSGQAWQGISFESDNAAPLVATAAEQKREAIRRELVKAVGGAMEAFRMIDLTGSSRITQTEFADGLQRIGIDWQELTGLPKAHEVFRLFDRDRNGALSIEELFPEDRYAEAATQRMSTPEFWGHWCKKTADCEKEAVRTPKWSPSSAEKDLKLMLDAADYRQDVADERRRMRSMIRRLQKQGKSDARCRECVATHLPRGTGPKDRDSVQAFSEAEVRACRRLYNETTNTHVRSISKNVYDMRESRKVLMGLRHKLWEPVMRAKQKDMMGEMVEGLHLFGPPVLSPRMSVAKGAEGRFSIQ